MDTFSKQSKQAPLGPVPVELVDEPAEPLVSVADSADSVAPEVVDDVCGGSVAFVDTVVVEPVVPGAIASQ
jgi:hypothetical protein